MIIDTNALSAVAEGHPSVESSLRNAIEVAIPVIVLGEYLYGVSQSSRRAEHENWLKEFIPGYRVLDVDQDTALRYAMLRSELRKAGTPIPSNDIWIAALSRQYALPILSRDRHFDVVNSLRRIDW